MKLKRISTLFTAVLLMFCVLVGCGGDTANVKCVDIVKACRDVSAEGTLDEWYSYGEEIYDDSFDSLYAVKFDMIDDGAVLQTASGGKADEVSVLHLKENADVSVAKNKLTDRISERKKQFEGYKPEEVYKLENAKVIVQGNYVALIACDDADAVEAEIRRVISEGAK